MRTFTRCLVVMAALVAMTVPSWSQVVPAPAVPTMSRADSLVQIDRLARKIAVANPGYPDPYQVPIGVLIRVPNAEGPDVFYKTEAWQFGKLGCWWQIAAWHLFSKRMDPPEATPPPAPAIKAGFDLAAMLAGVMALLGLIPWWALLLILLVIVAAAIASAYRTRERQRQQAREEAERARQEAEAQEQERQAEQERQMDYRNDPPVVAGGLSDDPNEALRQIQAADALYHTSEPGRQVIGARHGEMHSTNGRERVALRVEHTGSNGLESADRWINSGDRCTEVTVLLAGSETPIIEYWLKHCGNRFGEIRDGRFTMPEGWEFIPTGPAATVVPDPATEAETAAQRVEEAATTQVGRRNGRARDDKFTATVVITNNGGSNPKTRQTIQVTADRFVTELALPDGSKVTF